MGRLNLHAGMRLAEMLDELEDAFVEQLPPQRLGILRAEIAFEIRKAVEHGASLKKKVRRNPARLVQAMYAVAGRATGTENT